MELENVLCHRKDRILSLLERTNWWKGSMQSSTGLTRRIDENQRNEICEGRCIEKDRLLES